VMEGRIEPGRMSEHIFYLRAFAPYRMELSFAA
jgi:hypothetical protein